MDQEIKKMVLSEHNVNDWTVEKLNLFINGRESGKTDVQQMSKGGHAGAAINNQGGCKTCGRNRQGDRCGALGMTCHNCLKVGHLSRCCPERKTGHRKPTKKPAPKSAEAEKEYKKVENQLLLTLPSIPTGLKECSIHRLILE